MHVVKSDVFDAHFDIFNDLNGFISRQSNYIDTII